MRALLLTALAISAAMAFSGVDTAWEDLAMESTVSHCITWDENGGRMLVGTYEGFHSRDLASGEWTVVEENGMVGREVYCIDAGTTQPDIIITGRATAFDKGYMETSLDFGNSWDFYYGSTGGAFWALHQDVSVAGRFYSGAISDVEPGELLVSDDNGQNWAALDKPQEAVTDITQSLMGTLYTCGIPYVYKSDDGGTTWEDAAGGLSSGSIFYSIAAQGMDPNVLVCSDENGIYRTTDGGESWTQVGDHCCMEIEYCPGELSKLAAVTLGGSVLGSTDGGETWFDITGDLPGYPTGLAFCGDDDHLYVTTTYEGTYRTPATYTGTAGGTGAQTGPAGLSLAVSPNPVTATAAVSYTLPQAGSVRLDVFDVTGRLVRTLEGGQMAAGAHQSLIRVSDSDPGVLFVRLSTQSASTVQKVLVSR
jgi:photosystem II stability/assembly factor-like uncharacterized protein